MAGVTEGTIARLLRHSGTALVRRYAHLSPSYLQEAIEKVSQFGKLEAVKEPAKPEGKQEPERVDTAESIEAPEVLSSVSTGPGTGKAGEEIEGR